MGVDGAALAHVRERLHRPLDPEVLPGDDRLGVAPLSALELELVGVGVAHVHLAQVLTVPPDLVDANGIILVEGELPSQVELGRCKVGTGFYKTTVTW